MTKPIRASEHGLDPHWKVRIVIPNALLHLAAREVPRLLVDDEGTLCSVEAGWIDDPDYGDTLGHIDWSKVTAITWRFSE